MADETTATAPPPWLALLLAAAVTLFVGLSLLNIDTARGITLSDPNPSVASLTVRVTADGCGVVHSGSGTRLGDGYVATAAHVVDRAGTVLVSDDAGLVSEATVISLERGGLDVAILDIGLDIDVVTRAFGSSDPSPSIFAGHPGGGAAQQVATESFLVDAAAFDLPGEHLLSLADAPLEGMSGGPVVDDQGRLLGVVTSANTANGTGLAVPVVELQRLIDDARVDAAGC